MRVVQQINGNVTQEQVADEMINILRENIPNANQKLNRAPGKEALDRADTAFGMSRCVIGGMCCS